MHSWSALAVVLVTTTALLACGDKDEDDSGGGPDGGATDGGTGDGGTVDCWTVRPEECAATAGCVELKAREVVADGAGGWCVDHAAAGELVGCMPAGTDCGSAMSYATPPALPESCFEFTSTCVVGGWGACADEAMTSPGDCP